MEETKTGGLDSFHPVRRAPDPIPARFRRAKKLDLLRSERME